MAINVSPSLNKMMQRGKDFLGCEYPIMKGAMTWVSEPNLVAAVCNAGGFAALAGGNTPPEILREQIKETKRLTDKNFAVNLVTISPSYHSQIELLQEEKVPFVVFAGSIPSGKEIALVKATGAKVICFAPTFSLAKRVVKFGADALIIEGSEAGGHIGFVSTTVLLQQVLFELGEKLPIFVCGGIATGKMFAHMMMMGAAGVQLGTRFVMTEECQVHENFKNIFKRANAREAMSTSQFSPILPVVGVRAIKNESTEKFAALQLEMIEKVKNEEISKHDAQMKIEGFWMGALREAAIEGNIKEGSLMAGQSVGLVKNITTVCEMLEELITDANDEIEVVKGRL